MLAALYADAAERHRAAQDQGAMDLKGLFNDLKIRLKTQFELMKDQTVRVLALILQMDTELKLLGQYSQSGQRHSLSADSDKFCHHER